jgi:eukaryotic-like serine/threonine-protein kinase
MPPLDVRAPPDLGHPDQLPAGTRLGPYEITGFLGAGGMGEVYRAHDTNLDRIVALKLLPLELAADPERLHRFEDEARTASALSHPAVVTIYDAGQIGRQPFISMEFVPGQTLRELLSSGAIPLRRTLALAGQISEGLATAHEAGLVHRDLKPENIKVSIDRFAKILDFGLAKRVSAVLDDGSAGDAKTSLETSAGVVLGTVGYMSPEQAVGAHANFSSDQFSFGAILDEMLTGRRAFDRATVAETLSAIIREDPLPIAQWNSAIPAPVRWIVERCLSKEATERYALTRDLARDLASVREHLSELVASRWGRNARHTAGEASLAVLPVLNLSNDPKLEFLADVMTDALITELTQCRGLHVTSSASSMLYKGRRNYVPDIADELGVEWIVLASLAKAGGELRVAAQLVDARTDENCWAQSYIRGSRKTLFVQQEVAAVIARAIRHATASRPAAGTQSVAV